MCKIAKLTSLRAYNTIMSYAWDGTALSVNYVSQACSCANSKQFIPAVPTSELKYTVFGIKAAVECME
jgi:hypothetical protein